MERTATADLRIALEKWARDVEPRLLSGPNAARQLKQVARMEAIVASVKTRLARRVDESKVWQQGGHKTPAHFVARQTGTSIHQAVTILQNGERLEALPATAEAFTSGRVTQAQVNEIAPAAIVAPDREGELLGVADERNQALLRDTCRRVQRDGDRHPGTPQRRAPSAGGAGLDRPGRDLASPCQRDAHRRARIMARLNAETEKVFKEARAANARDSVDAYRFDALVRLAESTGSTAKKTRAHLFVNVDADKLIGGDGTGGGRCEIKGVGPVPVETARALMGDALLTILVKKGVDVTTIAHDGTKTMPASVRRAVLARDPECVVEVCSAPTREVHHVTWRSDGGEHSTTNCVGVCGWCHDLVHYHHYTLESNNDGTYHLRAPP